MRERLLTRHFLRRFLENDLISPDADRHEVLALLGAAMVTGGLFVSVLLSVKYLFQPFQSPGWTAVVALDDQFLFVACSMIVMALVAVAQWDALALDGRDASILGPLPVPRAVVVRAKLSALAVFAVAFVAGLNVIPSVLHPFLMSAKLRPGIFGVTTLVAAHGVSTVAAGAFGFASVLGLRELLRAVLGTRAFGCVSVFVQTALIVVLVSGFLLIPRWSSDVAADGLGRAAVSRFVPPFWFVGVHEMLAGHVLDRLSRPYLPAGLLEAEKESTELYRRRGAVFRQLATTALGGLALVVALAAAACVWNSRRLPPPPPAARRRRPPPSAAAARIVARILVWHPAARAGFFFTLQTLMRSVPHRVSIAASAAVGLAVATVGLRGTVSRGIDPPPLSLGLLAVQMVFLTLILLGFRHAVRIPAELRANWVFRLAWSGDERSYVAGSKRAAFAALAFPALLALLTPQALILGWRDAAHHFVFGLLLALVLIEALLLGFRQLPFACGYVPSPGLKVLAPPLAVIALGGVYGLAWLERLALRTDGGSTWLVATTMAAFVALRAVDLRQRGRVAVDLESGTDSGAQRLGLDG